jgi:type II secretory pathway component GspD/PulD (secretin)
MPVRLVFPLVALTLLVGPLTARGDDLDKFIEQNRILAQKVKSEVAQALTQARTLEKTDPEQAQAVLKQALTKVQNSTALPANEQTQLSSQLLRRLREVGDLMRQQKGGQQPLKELPNKPAAPAPGEGPAAVAQKFIEKSNTAVDQSAKNKQAKDTGFAGAVAGIGASATPPAGDVTFPKDWAGKIKLREKYAGPQLTPKEVALVRALNSVLTVEFNDLPLKQALEVLMDRTGQAILVDPESLKEASVEYATDPVSFPKTKVTFRTVLRKILAENRLTYVIKEGTIHVVTPAKARETMVVRTYPISDIVAPSGFALQFGPLIARAQMLANVQGVINLIETSIDPMIWQPNGGPASITFSEPTMSLVIRAPTEFHYQMAGGGLSGGR